MKIRKLVRKILVAVLVSAIMCGTPGISYILPVVTVSAASKLAAPKGITASSITDTSMTLKWNAVSGADAYKVWLWDLDSKKYVEAAFVAGTSAKVTGLEANTVCKFKIAAFVKKNGKYVKQSVSKAFSFKTKKSPLPAPSNFCLWDMPSGMSSDYFTMEWSTVKGADAYLIYYRKKGDGKWTPSRQSNGTLDYIDGSKARARVGGVSPDTTYEVCIRTCVKEGNKYVEQSTSDSYYVRTPKKDGAWPQQNVRVQTRSNRIDVFWDARINRTFVNSCSVIEIYSEKYGEWEAVKDSKGNDRVYEWGSARVSDLPANTSFKVRVWTVDLHHNRTACSEVFTVKTQKHPKDVWDGSVDTSWYQDGETEFNISTAAHLAGLAQLVRNGTHEDQFRGIVINLTKDIKLNDISDFDTWVNYAPANAWTPIGKEGSAAMGYRPFAGIFNGNGHTISGMYTEELAEAGLFAYTSGACIVNLKLKGSCIARKSESQKSCGALVGVSEGSYFDSCEAEYVAIDTKSYATYGTYGIGGLIGEAKRVNYIAVMTELTLMATFGIIINPFYIDLFNAGDQGPSWVSNCKVDNVRICAEQVYGDPVTGGIIGRADEGVYLRDCLSMNVSISSINVNGKRKAVDIGGAIYGQGKGECKNCYTYNFRRIDDPTLTRSDEKSVPEVAKSNLTSLSFAKDLGDAWEYVKDNAPKLKNIK